MTDVSNIALYGDQGPYFVPLAQIQPNLSGMYLLGAVNKLSLDAVVTSSNQFIVTLGELVTRASTSASDYSVSGPSTITVTGVTWNSTDTFITCTYTGAFVAGTYTLSITADTISDLNGNFNSNSPIPLLNTTFSVPTMTYVSPTGGASTIHLTYSLPPYISGDAAVPANWIITGSGVPVTVTSVTTSGNDIVLGVTEQTQGASYQVTMPAGISGISGVSYIALSGSFVANFTGTGIAPTILIAFPENDAYKVDVIFSEAVVDTEALVAANYSINNGLQVYSVDKLSDSSYRLHTSQQTAGVVYTLIVSNIHDLKGNLI